MTVRKAAGALAVTLLAVTGCGPVISYTDPVEGTVTLDGKPLGGVHLDFVPDGTPRARPEIARGNTDGEGRYRLVRDSGATGAFVGGHRVVVVRGREQDTRGDDGSGAADPVAANQAADLRPVPRQYNSPGTTPLRVEVTADRHGYDLELRSDPPK
jgi:hypothetical protein